MIKRDDQWTDERLPDDVHPAVRAEAAPPPVRRYRSELFQMVLLVLIVLFAGLTYLAEQAPIFQTDVRITHALQAFNTPPEGMWVTALMNMISWAGYLPQSLIVVGVVVAVLLSLGLRWEGLAALGAAAVVMVTDQLIKLLTQRPRPSADLVQVMKLLTSYSFPSGHVVFYTGFFGFLWYLAFTLLKHSWKRTLLLVIFGVLVLLVGISRIYLGVHWASDVVGAYMLGTLLLAGIIYVYRWGKKHLAARD